MYGNILPRTYLLVHDVYFEGGDTAGRVIVDFLLKCIMRVLYVQFALCSIDILCKCRGTQIIFIYLRQISFC